MQSKEVTVHEGKAPADEEYTRAGRTYRPNVDILEKEDGLWLWADLPGVDEKSIEVELDDGVLTISGHVATDDYEHLTPVYTEYNVGNLAHRFRLSSTIDGSKIKARMSHGVLELQLPKVEEAKPRQIAISG